MSDCDIQICWLTKSDGAGGGSAYTGPTACATGNYCKASKYATTLETWKKTAKRCGWAEKKRRRGKAS